MLCSTVSIMRCVRCSLHKPRKLFLHLGWLTCKQGISSILSKWPDSKANLHPFCCLFLEAAKPEASQLRKMIRNFHNSPMSFLDSAAAPFAANHNCQPGGLNIILWFSCCLRHILG